MISIEKQKELFDKLLKLLRFTGKIRKYFYNLLIFLNYIGSFYVLYFVDSMKYVTVIGGKFLISLYEHANLLEVCKILVIEHSIINITILIYLVVVTTILLLAKCCEKFSIPGIMFIGGYNFRLIMSALTQREHISCWPLDLVKTADWAIPSITLSLSVADVGLSFISIVGFSAISGAVWYVYTLGRDLKLVQSDLVKTTELQSKTTNILNTAMKDDVKPLAELTTRATIEMERVNKIQDDIASLSKALNDKQEAILQDVASLRRNLELVQADTVMSFKIHEHAFAITGALAKGDKAFALGIAAEAFNDFTKYKIKRKTDLE